jgi:hypothetical protein
MPTFPCVSVVVFDGDQVQHPPGGVLTAKEIEGVVDEDISEFERYFAQLGADPNALNERLHPMEKAAIKTYLHWKLFGP